MKLRKGDKVEIDGMKAEIVEEFIVGMNIRKGTKAVIVKKENNEYFVCNANSLRGEK